MLTSSAITREDYARNPQAVLDALGFYTEHQKREFEENGMTGAGMGMSMGGMGGMGGMTPLSSNRPPYGAPRFEGTGYAGAKSTASPAASTTSLVSREQEGTVNRPPLGRQDTAPPGLESKSYNSTRGEYGNGGGNTRAAGQPQLQATRPAPPRPQQQQRDKDQPPRPSPPRVAQNAGQQRPGAGSPASGKDPRELAPTKSREDGQSRASPSEREPLPVRKDSINERPLPQPSQQQQRQREREREREKERERERATREQQTGDVQRPQLVPSKSMPANSNPATDPAPGAAGALAGPPPVKPLQTAKKLPPTGEKDQAINAAAAALEKPLPKQVEKRFSAMTEAQIMDKLRSVVNQEDPKSLYTTIKKIGQG